MFGQRAVQTVSLLAFAAALVASPVAAQNDTTAAPRIRFNALELTLGGRLQTQFNTTSVDTVPGDELILRRVRLDATVKVSDLVSAKIQPEFAGERVTLADAFVRLHFDPAFEFLAGRAHRPFGIITPLSSVRMLPVERGASVRGISPLDQHNLVRGLGYSDRDVGVQVLGAPAWAPLGLTYAIGYFDGPLAARSGADAENPDQMAGRLSIRPLAPLRVGLSGSSREFRGIDTVTERTLRGRGTAWAVDAEWGSFAPGLHVIGELSWGDFNPLFGTDFVGAQGWIAYRTGPLGRLVVHLEPLLRISSGDLDDSVAAGVAARQGTLFTPGLNLYFDPLNRLMVNWDVWNPGDDAQVEHSFKAMLQFAF